MAGVVTVPALPVGQVKVHVEFVGFETYEGELGIRRGANNQTVTMKLAGFTDEVVVPANALGHAHIWCGGLTRVGCGGFQNRESV